MVSPGDVVTVNFPGVMGLKRRPAVVLSTPTYHGTRPDVVLGLVTTQIGAPLGPTDYILQDWTSAGLHNPSAFRAFIVTVPLSGITVIGHLSQRDWREVQGCIRTAMAFS